MMNVGKLDNAKTIKLLRQSTQVDRLVFDCEHVRLGESGSSGVGKIQC